MSGSPKYSSYSMSYEREQALAAERARLAAIEAAQKAAEAERLRQVRLAEARSKAGRRASKLGERLAGLANGDLAPYAGDAAAGVAAQLPILRHAVGQSVDEKQITQLSAQLERLKGELARIEASAKGRKLAADLDAEAADATEIEQLLTTIDRDVAERFDRDGAQASSRLLAELRSALGRESLEAARGLAAEARRAVEGHLDTAQTRYEDWQLRRDRAEQAIASVADQVAAARADQVCARWVGRDLAIVAAALDSLSATANGDQPDGVHEQCRAVATRLGDLSARAQELQLNEERRQAMVKGLLAVMDRMSFTLQKGYPVNEDESDPASTVKIRVRRGADRSSVDVGIAIDGSVSYEVDGFARRLETGSDGKDAATCDEAEEQIEAFHEMLEEQFGVHAEELRWVDKNPTRNLRTARQLPSSAPAHRTV